MKRHFAYSKRLHLATLCCFLLPFFYTGCGDETGETEAQAKAKQDSIQMTNNPGAGVNAPDTAFKMETTVTPEEDLAKEKKEQTKDTTAHLINPHEENKANTIEKDNSNLTASHIICKKAPFLKPVLIPKENTYSGIAAVIDTAAYLFYFAVFLSFLLLIISLIVKLMEANARKTIVLLNLLGLVSLYLSVHFSGYSERLWGFWVAFSFVALLTIYDIGILIIVKKDSTQRTQN
jgi:hypothetical protein